MDFLTKLDSAVTKNNSLLCVGLDPNIGLLPEHLRNVPTPYLTFNKAIIDAVAESVCAFKPNSAFYESKGAKGIEELKATFEYIQTKHPEIPIILDFKRGDIGSTNDEYAKFAFEYLGEDAITIKPYMGREAVEPFLDYKQKGIIVLARTSNSGAGEIQDLEVDGRKLYLRLVDNILQNWNANKNCLLVVGATYPDELAQIRELTGDEMVYLVPGVGAQGGDVEATVKAGQNANGKGVIINSTRDIIYASLTEDFAEVAGSRAKEVRDEINKYRSNTNV